MKYPNHLTNPIKLSAANVTRSVIRDSFCFLIFDMTRSVFGQWLPWHIWRFQRLISLSCVGDVNRQNFAWSSS
jgi:hypothetical protein